MCCQKELPIQFKRSQGKAGLAYPLLSFTESLNQQFTALQDQKGRGVITATSGNHGIALAFHGQALEIPVHVILPEHSPLIKQTMCKKFGAKVTIKGSNQLEASKLDKSSCKIILLPDLLESRAEFSKKIFNLKSNLMFQAKEFATSMATEKRLAYIDGWVSYQDAISPYRSLYN